MSHNDNQHWRWNQDRINQAGFWYDIHDTELLRELDKQGVSRDLIQHEDIVGGRFVSGKTLEELPKIRTASRKGA